MIEAAMLFALGALVSALVALLSIAAVVRRTRRVTERRLKASLATRRAEYDTERDELRARHAVDLRRLEREAGRLRDEATARRLEADLKDQELAVLRADLEARSVEVEDLSQRLERLNETLLEAERRLAENRATLRTTQHSVSAEIQRRAALQTELDAARALLDERQGELTALAAENERLHASLEAERQVREMNGSYMAEGVPLMPGVALPAPDLAAPGGARDAGEGVVVPLPARETAALARLLAVDPSERTPESERVEKIALEISRMAGEAEAGLQPTEWRVPAKPGDGVRPALKAVPAPEPETPPASRVALLERPQENDRSAETRFFEALEEIRSMKRAGGAPPGE